jgi:hypothetical protein
MMSLLIRQVMKVSPFNIPIGAKFLWAVLMVVCFTTVASATLIDFEDLSDKTSGSNLAEIVPDYAGLDWTLPNNLAHWVIENDGTPFSGNSGTWLKGTADTLGYTPLPGEGSKDFAKITQLNNIPFNFISMDLRGRSDKPQWLTTIDIRARDIHNAEVIATVNLTDTWTTYTASDLGFTSLAPLKSLTFFGTSAYTDSDNNDRFALDNLDVASTPEPTTLVLIGLGLLGVLGVVIRQRRKEK